MHRIALLAALLVLTATATSASAQRARSSFGQAPYSSGQGTPQERAACSPDARRFCRNAGGDEMRVLSCLQQNRGRLSRACRGVLARSGV
jgi:hypothetical protein